jgi:hypothetical protein
MEPRTQPPAPVASEVDDEAEYKTAWKEFDPSLNGSITAAQFRQLMAGMGETVTDAEVDEIINSVDDEDKISCELPSILKKPFGLTCDSKRQGFCPICEESSYG